jgi:hypothetical protein
MLLKAFKAIGRIFGPLRKRDSVVKILNSSLSNLYNNVAIYKIKKVVRTVLFVNEFTEFSYSWYNV